MISFFVKDKVFYSIESEKALTETDIHKLVWLTESIRLDAMILRGYFIGPRKEMITPWSTNAVEIIKNMSVEGILRMEKFIKAENKNTAYDPMLQDMYKDLTQTIFTIDRKPSAMFFIDNINKYNEQEGLALSSEEIAYLEKLSRKLKRKLTDSEVFGFSQVNSEHCRHKIFNGKFFIDGNEKPKSLFELIKKTSEVNPNYIVSAYKDNCALLKGPQVYQFAPLHQDRADYFILKPIQSLISIKAETHNFPTTVEPFNGAATGSGGEIRDRMAGGQAAIPLAGTAVYMTAYSRSVENRPFEKHTQPRKWLYQIPLQILIKASDGASDYGNKFGQPLICGSVLTFENNESTQMYGYDKVIMLAGGIGYAREEQAKKKIAKQDDKIILLGGDNYRIGMGGGTVSSVATGEYGNTIELNAVQRSNPEMQKRIFNAIRAMAESNENKILSIHDHGAGGHLNCLSELVAETGGCIFMDKLPIGDPTLSAKEIAGNESQERMGLTIGGKDIKILQKICERERAPCFEIGKIRTDKKFIFKNRLSGEKTIDLDIDDFFGNPPKTIMRDYTSVKRRKAFVGTVDKLTTYIEQVLQLEAVACKDWLTNKVDRSVGGKVAMQQCTGKLQLPLNNLGISTIDYLTNAGVATAIGHAPMAAMLNSAIGSRLSVAEALTNIIWTPIRHGIKGISLSANWMWPSKNRGEDARLYEAVEAISRFCIELGINIPTGKDSLSMTQKYPDGRQVLSPGTVIVTAVAETSDITKAITPVIQEEDDSELIYIDFSKDTCKLGGSCLAQIYGKLGSEPPDVMSTSYFVNAFEAVQQLINEKKILAGHDISAGGTITTLLEMCVSNPNIGLEVDISNLQEKDLVKILFNEKPGIIIQTKEKENICTKLQQKKIHAVTIGKPSRSGKLRLIHKGKQHQWDIAKLRDIWFKSSYLLDCIQSGENFAKKRFHNYKHQFLDFQFPEKFSGKFSQFGINRYRQKKTNIQAAIIREKGVNGDREMAWAMYLAGMDVKDIHMTDLVNGKETFENVHMIVFVGGFSNSDVLGSAKGWAGAFLYNVNARKALEVFYARKDTLSLGVCNGCQLMAHLGLLGYEKSIRLTHNDSKKFESAFVNVDIPTNNSIMLHNLSGTRLGVWIAHSEGKFVLNKKEVCYNIPMKYTYSEYPGLPNGSDYTVAGICSKDGRHLAMMPHIERSIHPWNWAYYPKERKNIDEVSPWIQAFVNARKWIEKNNLQIKTNV